MNALKWLFIGSLLILPLTGKALTYPTSLTNEIDGCRIDASARKLVVLIHGWNPSGAPDSYTGTEWSLLKNAARLKLAGSDWKLVPYHWEPDANTGLISWDQMYGVQNAANAADKAVFHGQYLGEILERDAPDLRQVHLIAHSAGAWAARQAAIYLLEHNPYVTVQVTLLDPFIPSTTPFPLIPITQLTLELMNGLAQHPQAARLYRLENYFAEDTVASDWPTLGTDNIFSWRPRDINKRIDHGATLTPGINLYYDSHSGPILFYSDTVCAMSSGGFINDGLSQSTSPDFTQFGWGRCLSYEWFLLPRVTGQPQSQTVPSGTTISLAVTATDSRPLFYQWFRNGTPITGATSSTYPLTVTVLNMGDYVACVSNANGAVFSDKAKIEISSPNFPVIYSISPRTLTGQSVSQTQSIKIIGTNFTSSSRLTFDDGVNPPYLNREPASSSPTQLLYNISVGPYARNWTAKVVNDSVESAPYSFYVVAADSILGGLSISGPATIAEAGSGQFTATALFSDGTSRSVTPTWSVTGSASIGGSGILSAANIDADTLVTVSASYMAGGVTKTATANVMIVNITSGSSQTQQELIINGGFENGQNSWTMTGAVVPSTALYPHTGNKYAVLGEIANTLDTMYQQITVPANATAATLTYWYNIVSEESTATAKDRLFVSIANATGSWLGWVDQLSNQNKDVGAGNPYYHQKSFDLTAYKGQTIRVNFAVQTDSSGITSFKFDDVSVQAVTPIPASLTSLIINGPSSVTEGNSAQYTATAVFSDGSTTVVTPNTWNDNSSATSISGSGLLTAGQVAADTGVTIQASFTYGGVTRTSSKDVSVINVAAPIFSYLAINGPSYISENSSGQFTATAIFSDGSSVLVPPIWSENSSVAAISPAGVLTASEVNNDVVVSVSASYSIGGVTCTANQNVTIRNEVAYTLVSVLANPGRGGTANGGGSFASGSEIQISATPVLNWVFTGWNDGDKSNPRNIVVPASGGTYTANFAAVGPQTGSFFFAPFSGQSVIGSEDGAGGIQAAQFRGVSGIAIDRHGNLFLADQGSHTIRKASPDGIVSTLAGLDGNYGYVNGTVTQARFNAPRGVAVDAGGNVYVIERYNYAIRKITPDGNVTTLAGFGTESAHVDGTGGSARFTELYGIVVDESGTLFVSEYSGATIRKVTASGIVTTIAGSFNSSGNINGTGTVARFTRPMGLDFDADKNLIVADGATIRRVTTNGVATTVAGTGVGGYGDGPCSNAQFDGASSVAVDSDNNIFVTDRNNYVIRRISTNGTVSTVAGVAGSWIVANGTGTVARFTDPTAITYLNGNFYIAEQNRSRTIRKLTLPDTVSSFCGLGSAGYSDGAGLAATFRSPKGIAFDASGNLLVADWWHYILRKVDRRGTTTTIAGKANSSGYTNGMGSSVRFGNLGDVAVDTIGNVYVVDVSNHAIRKVDPNGMVTTFAGGSYGTNDGVGAGAKFNQPRGIALDTTGNFYVADNMNHTIRKITPDGTVTTFAGLPQNSGVSDGNGSTARFYAPEDVVCDAQGNVFVADAANNTIRKITPARDVSTFAGSAGNSGNTDGQGATARFNRPHYLAKDKSGNLYVTDNNGIRRVSTNGTVSTISGNYTVDSLGSGIEVDADGNIYLSTGTVVYKGSVGATTVSGSADPIYSGRVLGAGTFMPETSVALSAAPDVGWGFTGWADGSVANPRMIIVGSSSSNYVARFGLLPAIVSATANPAQGGSVQGAGTYSPGTIQSISATNNAGWGFVGWADGNTQNPRLVLVPPGTSSYTANFVDTAPEPSALIAVVNPFSPIKGGSVLGCGMFKIGTQQVLTAAPWDYYHFSGWAGQTNGCAISSNQITVVVDGERVVTALFTEDRATNNVPVWWLAGHGLTNYNFDAMQDIDEDGFMAWEEYVAGTDPTNAASVFKVKGCESSSNKCVVVKWPSVAGRLYTLKCSTNLAAGFSTSPSASDIPATPPENTYTVPAQTSGACFYRIDVHE